MSKSNRAQSELSLWCVYDHPKDHPNEFIARRWIIPIDGPPKPTSDVVGCTKIETMRALFREKQLVEISRSPDDDPKILEVWM